MSSRCERSKRVVYSLISDLEAEYGEFEVLEKTWHQPPARCQRLVDQFEDAALGGAGVWLTNDAGDVLLVQNVGDEGWSDPGGSVEVGEPYEDAAIREVREETGIECELTGLREVHVVEHRNTETDEPVAFEAIAIFHGEYVEGEPRPREGEIADVDWFSRPPETVLYEEVRTRPYPGRD
ncbi:NUDIX hydrolase [Natrarchaeobius sp. A-rgal3]|uniref:NUDIX hydrolase n=1 Tax=Natrarchaeobius versutus TaxID=1679078 RepID=UPI00350FECCE